MPPKKPVEDYIVEILEEYGRLEASRIKDLLFDRVAGRTPSIRGVSGMLKRDDRFVSREASAWEKQIKTWELKNAPQKKLPRKKLSNDFCEGER